MLNIKTKLRRAFTIVELVVVIAVIAALAAILIPTFANVIKSANESADMQLVKNLNTILATDEAINGAPSTMDDVLAVTSENGYNIDKLTPSSSGDIVWDQNTNRFVLINEDGEVIYYDDSYDAEEAVLWYITDSTTILTDKNYYYANAVTTDNGSLTLTSGADLSNTEVESVTINASNTQISVTVNNAAVTVSSDSNSTVNLYGTISTVEGTYGTNSLHIYGTVTGKIVLSSGRVVAEKGSYIESIIITATTLSSDIKIEAESSSSINSIGATESTVAAGISSISKGVSSSAIVSTAVSNDFAGGAGTEASPYQIATAQQFANINKLDFTNNSYHFVQTADITVTSTINYFSGSYNGCYNGSYYTLSVSSTSYMIYYITGHCTIENLTVDMDGNAYTLFYCADWGTSYGVDVDNITFNSNTLVEANSNNYGLVVANAIYTPNDGSSTEYNFTNITNNAQIQNNGTCTGFIIGSGPCFNNYTVLNYENCTNNATITGSQTVGFIYGNYAYIASAVNGEINVTNCVNNGTLRSIQTNGIAAFAPGLDTNEYTKETYADKCAEWQKAAGGVFRASNFFDESGNGFEAVYQSGTTFAVSATSTDITYKLVLSVGATYFMADGSAWNSEYESDLTSNQSAGYINVSNSIRYFAALTADSEVTGTLNTFYAYDTATAISVGIIESADDVTFTNGFAIVVKDSTNYMIINKDSSYYISSSVTTYVYAYDANGNLLGLKAI